MTLLGSENITLRQIADGTLVDAIYTPGAATDTTISATVRPLKGDELQMLQDAERQRDPKKVFSETNIELGDRLIIDGLVYKVIMKRDNERHGFLQHTSVVAIKEKDD